MTSYAILGATGNCGSSLIQVLLESPRAKIHAYCRNKGKLIRNMPELAENERVQIFEGHCEDVDLLASCVRGCRAVFHTLSMNDNVPGCHVAQDTAFALVAALGKIKAELGSDSKLPMIVLLSSATIDDRLSCNVPKWFRPIMLRAASYGYEDLRVTERFLRKQQDWVSTVFVKPGGLAIDKRRGHKLSLDEQETFVSYLDLAAAMVEVADDDDNRYDMKNVSVVNTGGSASFPRALPLSLLLGLARHYFPFLHSYLPSSG